MKKKGFTLIELLAVIVILAIIALIATPIIMGVIEDAKKNSAKDSAYGYIDGINNYYAKQLLKDSTFKLGGIYSVSTDGKLKGIDLGIKGKKPVGGTLIYSNNKITSGCLTIDGYKVTITNDKAEKVEKGTCEENGPTIIDAEVNATYKKIMYADPTDLTKKCTEADVVSTTGTKSGCMKWYAYKDNGDGTYNWILDHNTTAGVVWLSKADYISAGGTEADYGEYGNNNKGPITVTNKLKSDTSSWNESLNARLITANEIAGITGNTSFDSKTSTSGKWFYLDSNTQTRVASSSIKSKYAWLYDYTNGCTTYGCNASDSSNYGYWTNDAVSGLSSNAWRVYSRGNLTSGYVSLAGYGVRPVITF